ncbi:hypothetical protein ACFFGH_06475 [Lysobacter korlensis]|uniref:Lipoprotein n=1 Tax=Lysobacter korlensis TaxID=553636 RepID=A0ABV6RKI8_9GAMM
MRTIISAALLLALVACSTTQVHRNSATMYAPTSSSAVQVLYSAPRREYESIGIVSAKRYKPGFTDPTVADAIPQLQAAGAQLGADAVIVQTSRSNNDRHTVVDGEAIRFVDRPVGASQSTATGECKACGTIGG